MSKNQLSKIAQVWATSVYSNAVHVIPVNDLKVHTCLLTNSNRCLCLCQPSIQITTGLPLIVHNSFDGREFYEQDNENLSDIK